MNSTNSLQDLLSLSSAPHNPFAPVVETRALWTQPASGEDASGEDGASAHRLIHARALRLSTPVRLSRLGLRAGAGYMKCGSDVEITLAWVRVRPLAAK